MTALKLKSEIMEGLENVPDDKLPKVLTIVQEWGKEKYSDSDDDWMKMLEEIMEEDDEVFKALAK